MYATNTLPVRKMSESLTGCCPPFDPADWDDREFIFDDKLFLKFSTRSILHVPVNMNAMMTEMMTLVQEENANSPDGLMLSRENSPWSADHFIAVTREIPGANMVRMSGTFVTKVFDGPYSEMQQWYRELIDYAKSEGHETLAVYFNYALCPNCAKAYGHNYVVGFVQVA